MHCPAPHAPWKEPVWALKVDENWPWGTGAGGALWGGGRETSRADGAWGLKEGQQADTHGCGHGRGTPEPRGAAGSCPQDARGSRTPSPGVEPGGRWGSEHLSGVGLWEVRGRQGQAQMAWFPEMGPWPLRSLAAGGIHSFSEPDRCPRCTAPARHWPAPPSSAPDRGSHSRAPSSPTVTPHLPGPPASAPTLSSRTSK